MTELHCILSMTDHPPVRIKLYKESVQLYLYFKENTNRDDCSTHGLFLTEIYEVIKLMVFSFFATDSKLF